MASHMLKACFGTAPLYQTVEAQTNERIKVSEKKNKKVRRSKVISKIERRSFKSTLKLKMNVDQSLVSKVKVLTS